MFLAIYSTNDIARCDNKQLIYESGCNQSKWIRHLAHIFFARTMCSAVASMYMFFFCLYTQWLEYTIGTYITYIYQIVHFFPIYYMSMSSNALIYELHCFVATYEYLHIFDKHHNMKSNCDYISAWIVPFNVWSVIKSYITYIYCVCIVYLYVPKG